MAHKPTVILYHSKCIDGFGAAYAAWKKFGEEAEYIPVSYGKPVPEHMQGRDLFMLDFCYKLPEMEKLSAEAKSLTVIDHHEGMHPVATKYPGVFDPHHSGATIAWEYFHPNTSTPTLLTYVEDGDLYRYQLPETEDVYSALIVEPYDFARWDEIAMMLNDKKGHKDFLAKAEIYTEYFRALGHLSVAGAKMVMFEGYEVTFAITHPVMAMKSFVGAELSHAHPPFALVVSAHPDGFGVSIRGAGQVDVAAIARKYGGDGHHDSAGFFIPATTPLPWKEVGSQSPSAPR